MAKWKLEDAKNGFSEVVRRARSEGPQFVTKHGRDAVVIVSAEAYEELAGATGLVAFLQDSPLAEALECGELTLERERDLGRETVLD